MSGIKYDQEKADFSLLNLSVLTPLVKVLMLGERKYARDNWMHVRPTRRYFAAALRHLAAYQGGEQFDRESGESHLAHALACLYFASAFEQQGKLSPATLNAPDEKVRLPPVQPRAPQPPSEQFPASGPPPSRESGTDTNVYGPGSQRQGMLLSETELERFRSELRSAVQDSVKASAETQAPESSTSATQTTPAASYEDTQCPCRRTEPPKK